eukprot:SAG11_NODE_3376_length_2488_cov_49.264964_2_plen_308_part_01
MLLDASALPHGRCRSGVSLCALAPSSACTQVKSLSTQKPLLESRNMATRTNFTSAVLGGAAAIAGGLVLMVGANPCMVPRNEELEERESAVETMAAAAELRNLKMSALKQRAIACGVSKAEIENADKALDARSTLVELIIKNTTAVGSGSSGGDRCSGLAREQNTELLHPRLPQTPLRRTSKSSQKEELCSSTPLKFSALAPVVSFNSVARTGNRNDLDDMFADEEPGIATLRSELAPLKLRALQKRAAAAGVEVDAMDDALDSDDPKNALISLLVQRCVEVGAVAEVMPALKAGGEEAAAVLGPCLD